MHIFCNKLECLSLHIYVNLISVSKAGSISSTFLAPKQSQFCVYNFWFFQWQQHLAKMCQNMGLGAKAVAQNTKQNFFRNFGETELHLLRPLLYVGTFAHCTNWSVKWGSVTHQMAVPVPSISCCVLNHHNLFYQIQNVLAFNCDTCCPLALCLRLLPFHYLVYLGTDKIKNMNVQINKKYLIWNWKIQ